MLRDMFGRLIKTDIFGRKISKKKLKREVLEENRQKGKSAEENYEMRAQLAGYEVERKHKGQDYIERQRNPWTGRVERTTHVEVKSSSTAPLSKLQQKTKKKKSNHKIVREESIL